MHQNFYVKRHQVDVHLGSNIVSTHPVNNEEMVDVHSCVYLAQTFIVFFSRNPLGLTNIEITTM